MDYVLAVIGERNLFLSKRFFAFFFLMKKNKKNKVAQCGNVLIICNVYHHTTHTRNVAHNTIAIDEIERER